MAEIIHISNGEWAAGISTDGAWLESLEHAGEPVFYPKETFMVDGKPKLRGGCHVCLPNFGPGGESGLPQHGFGREMEWQVAEHTGQMVVFELAAGVDTWQALSSQLCYELLPDGLSIELQTTNNGAADLPLSPGFHPYFVTNEATEVRVDDDTYALDQLAEFRIVEQAPQALSIGENTYQVSANNLPIWVLWSDRLAPYVCLEPTAAGNSFSESTPPMLARGATNTYSYSLQRL